MSIVQCESTRNEETFVCAYPNGALARGHCPVDHIGCQYQCAIAEKNECEPDDCQASCETAYESVTLDCQIAAYALAQCIYRAESFDDAVCVPGRAVDFGASSGPCEYEQAAYASECPAVIPWPGDGGTSAGSMGDGGSDAGDAK